MALYHYVAMSEHYLDEIYQLLTEDEREAAARLLEERQQSILDFGDARLSSLFVFLGKTDKNRRAQFSKLAGTERLIWWLQARFLALRATNALKIADSVAWVEGYGYRKAFRSAAEQAHRQRLSTTAEELVFYRPAL